MNVPKGYYIVPEGEWIMSNFLYKNIIHGWIPTKNRDKHCQVNYLNVGRYAAPLLTTPRGNKRV